MGRSGSKGQCWLSSHEPVSRGFQYFLPLGDCRLQFHPSCGSYRYNRDRQTTSTEDFTAYKMPFASSASLTFSTNAASGQVTWLHSLTHQNACPQPSGGATGQAASSPLSASVWGDGQLTALQLCLRLLFTAGSQHLQRCPTHGQMQGVFTERVNPCIQHRSDETIIHSWVLHPHPRPVQSILPPPCLY